jgi:hypothetical protein
MADAPTAPPETGTDPTTATEPPPDPAAALAAAQQEAEKWKQLSRKNEEAAKRNADAAKRIKDLEKEGMDATERAVAAAREEEAAAAAKRWGTHLVAAEVRAAASHLTPEQRDALAEAVDASKFLTDEGEVDTDAIRAWVQRAYPPPAEEQPPPGFPDVAQGARGGPIVPPAKDGLAEFIRRAAGNG